MRVDKINQQLIVLVPAAFVCAVLLFVGGPGFDSLRSYRYGWEAGHLFSFALWTYLYSLWRRACSFWSLAVEVLLLTIVVGGLTEILQSLIGREGSWLDLGNDIVGCLIGLFFLTAVRRVLPSFWLRSMQLPVLILVIWSLIPTGRVIIDDLIAHQQFPLLSGFETSLEASRWHGSAKRTVSGDIASSGQSSLQIKLNTQRYSGLGLKDFPRDWSAYRVLSLQVFNPDAKPLMLHFRLHDHLHSNQYSDRYNHSFNLKTGWNELVISLADVATAPKNRLFDLSRVAGMGVFVGKLERSRTIYLDDVLLLP